MPKNSDILNGRPLNIHVNILGEMVNGISGAMQTDEERKAAALRIIRRAKRAGGLLARDRAYSTCEGGQFPPCSTKEPPSRSAKNSRKSRSGFGRGLPKKGKFLVI